MNFDLSTGALIAALLSATSLPATAGSADVQGAPVKLQRFDVSGDRLRSFTPLVIEEARTELALTPGGTEVVDARRYLGGRASTVEDTFRLSAGVFAQSRFGSDEARISIRGSGLQRTFHGRGLRILQDGVPLNLADGSFDMQAFEPLSTAYINVWRGANALAQGASTLGGAIEYISRTGRDGAKGMLRLEAGSDQYLRAGFAGGGHSERLDAFASFTHQSQEGFRKHARQNSQRLFTNAGFRFGSSGETRFYVTGVLTDSELPGSVTRAQLENDPTQAASANVTMDHKRDFTLIRLASRTTLRSGPIAWDLTAAWTTKDLNHPIFQVITQRSDDVLLGLAGTIAGSIAEHDHRLRAGLQFHHGVIRAGNFVNAAGQRGNQLSAARQTAANLEAFIEDQITLGRGITLVAGASAATNRRDNKQLIGGSPDYSHDYHQLMPKLGLRWDGSSAQMYANISASYEPPSFSETLTLNTARDAQTARTIELGTRGSRSFLSWDASIYHAVVRRELLAIDHDNDPATAAITINADRTRHSGVELATSIDLLGGDWNAAAEPAHRLVLRAAWTYGSFRFQDDPVYGRNTLAGLPPHLIRGELIWGNDRGWYAGPTVTWVPQKSWIDHRNTLAADPYAIAGFRIGRRTARGLSWFLDARNLADKIHAASTGVIENAAGLDQPQFLPGDGRSVYMGVTHQW